MDSLQPARANFEPEYAASAVMPSRPPRLDTFTMVPALRSSMRGSTASEIATGDR